MAPFTTLERLRVFEAVASAGTIAGAARSLGYTASAVSQHVSRLEREASTALVERSNRGISMTPAGRALATRAGEILDRTRNALDEIQAGADRTPTVVTIAAFPTAITEALLPVRADLSPAIDLRIIAAESDAAVRMVTNRAVDAAIIDGYAHSLREPAPGLLRELLSREFVRLVARADGTEGSFEAYARRDWVIGAADGPIGHALRTICHEAGTVPNVIAETDDHRITFDVIRSTNAVSLLPELALTTLPGDLAIDHDIELGLERRIEFVTRSTLSDNPTVDRCAQAIATTLNSRSTGLEVHRSSP